MQSYASQSCMRLLDIPFRLQALGFDGHHRVKQLQQLKAKRRTPGSEVKGQTAGTKVRLQDDCRHLQELALPAWSANRPKLRTFDR